MAKIMLVEDDNNLREIYAARLQAEGYTVVSAKDGEEALVIAKAEKPDLIISDIMMPKISGFEMLDILRNTDGLRDVKIIMLTALGQNDDEMRASRLGADRYLVKSQVTLEDIVKVSRGLIEGEAKPVVPTPAVSATSTTTATAPSPSPSPTSTTPPPVSPAPTVAPVAMATPPSDPPVASTPLSPPTPPAAAPMEAPAATTTTSTPIIKQDEVKAPVQPEVESFVAGATSEPSAPPPVLEAPAPVVVASTTPDSRAPSVPDPLAPTATESTPPVVTETTPSTPPAPSERKKTIITPIDSEPKKDLTTLLAQEEAKEAASATVIAGGPTTTAPVIAGDSTGPLPPTTPTPIAPPPSTSPDPNSIAL